MSYNSKLFDTHTRGPTHAETGIVEHAICKICKEAYWVNPEGFIQVNGQRINRCPSPHKTP